MGRAGEELRGWSSCGLYGYKSSLLNAFRKAHAQRQTATATANGKAAKRQQRQMKQIEKHKLKCNKKKQFNHFVVVVVLHCVCVCVRVCGFFFFDNVPQKATKQLKNRQQQTTLAEPFAEPVWNKRRNRETETSCKNTKRQKDKKIQKNTTHKKR